LPVIKAPRRAFSFLTPIIDGSSPRLYNPPSFVYKDSTLGNILRLAWNRWRLISRINGDYLARIVVNLFYFTILVPFALGVEWFSDPLELRSTKVHWLERKPVSTKLDDARGQF